jgi:hypothetical protein
MQSIGQRGGPQASTCHFGMPAKPTMTCHAKMAAEFSPSSRTSARAVQASVGHTASRARQHFRGEFVQMSFV